MSYFSTKLAELLDTAKPRRNQSDLARLTGLSAAHISNLITGVQTWVSKNDLENIAQNATDNDVKRAELIRAYLLDQCHGPGSDLIEITIRDGKHSQALYDRPVIAPLSPRKERALEIIRANAANRQAWIVIEGVAEMLDGSAPPKPDSPTTPPVPEKETDTSYLKRRRKKP